MTGASTNDDLSSHGTIAAELLHGRSWASGPRVSPDGRHVASVVATIDLDQNTTNSRVWLDGSPVTAGPYDGQPRWSPDGRWLAFTSRRGEKKGDSTLHVMPVGGPGEVRTVCTMPDGLGAVAWSPDGRWLGFVSRVRDARYEAKDESWQAPRKIERFLSRLNGEGWVFDRPQHVWVVAADGTGVPRDLTPGEFEHDGVAWLADSTGIVTSSRRHDTWDRDLAVDLYVVPLDGEIRALTSHTGQYSSAAVSPDGALVAFIGNDDPLTYPQNPKVGVIPVDGGDHRWISEALDRPFTGLAGGQPVVWLDNDTVLSGYEDRGEAHVARVHVDGRPPDPVTEGAITVTGFDDDPITLGGVKEGTVVGTVVQQPYLWGYEGMKDMAKILEGDKSFIPDDGLIIIPTKVVDQSNVDEYAKELAKMQGKG